MSSVTQQYGWILEVERYPLGSGLTQAAVAGDDVLHVADASPFEQDGGALALNGEMMGYTSADYDADTITLSGPLSALNTGDEGDLVQVWDTDNSRAASEPIAHVEFANGDGDDDPIVATIAAGVVAKLRTGARAERGETVLLEEYGGVWRVVDVTGQEQGVQTDGDGDPVLGPAAPVLVGDSTAYVNTSRQIRARVNLDWSDVDTYADGSAFEPGEGFGYEMHGTHGNGVTGVKWIQVGYTDYGTSEFVWDNLDSGYQLTFRVRAIVHGPTAGTAIRGEWSNLVTLTTAVDNTPPPMPSAPTVESRLGAAIVRWNGLDAAGNAMPSDFGYAELHMSATSGFVPVKGDTNTLMGIMAGADLVVVGGHQLAYGETRYFRLLAVDRAGNVSTPSDQTAATVTPIVDTDLIGQVVAGANIVDGSIAAYEKVIAESITSLELAALAVKAGKIDTNAVTAATIDVGSLFGLVITGLYLQTDFDGTTGLKLRNAGFTAFGGGVPTVFIDASSGDATFRGSIVAGSTITGAEFNTTGAGNRVRIADESGAGWVRFFYGYGGEDIENTGGIAAIDAGDPKVQLSSGLYPGKPYAATMALKPGSSGQGTVQFNAGVNMDLSCQVGFNLGVSNQINAPSLPVVGAGQHPVSGESGSRYALTQSTAGWIKRVDQLSSRRYKDIVDDLSELGPNVLEVAPITFRYLDIPGMDFETETVNIGVPAEDLYEAGFVQLVGLDEEGLPSGVDYSRLSVAVLAGLRYVWGVVEEERAARRQQDETIAELRALVDSLA